MFLSILARHVGLRDGGGAACDRAGSFRSGETCVSPQNGATNHGAADVWGGAGVRRGREARGDADLLPLLQAQGKPLVPRSLSTRAHARTHGHTRTRLDAKNGPLTDI